MKFAHKLLLLGGAVAVGYGALAWYLPAAARRREQTALNERLDTIEASLAQLLARAPEAGDAGGDGLVRPREAGLRATPLAGAGDERLAEAVERLIDMLEAQTRLLASARAKPVSLDDLRARHPEPIVTELARTHAAWLERGDETRRELQLLSRAEVLARFGSPTEVDAGSWTWVWGSSDARDPAWTKLVLSFDGDYVHGVRFSS
jgi:hypothetical protein